MSRSERFFTPRSLYRVASHVEWESDLVFYNDGSSNQSKYMRTIGFLLSQWLTDETLVFAIEQAAAVESEDWSDAVQRALEHLPRILEQCIGFWRGVFRIRRRSLFSPIPWTGYPTPPPAPSSSSSIEDELYLFVDSLLRQVRDLMPEEEEYG